jgi:hypothetical protein
VANKYAIVDCGLFDSTIRTDLAPIVFEYTDSAFVHARSAAEHPQAEPVRFCIRKYEGNIGRCKKQSIRSFSNASS